MQQQKSPGGKPATYAITVVTSSGSETIEAQGDQNVRSAIQRAFAKLGITKPADQFTIKDEAGATIDLNRKIEDVCPTHTCKLFADPTKADQG